MSECRCGHPQHTHVRYVHSCGLCDCLTFRSSHDDQCEAEFIGEAGAWTDCGCSDRRDAAHQARRHAASALALPKYLPPAAIFRPIIPDPIPNLVLDPMPQKFGTEVAVPHSGLYETVGELVRELNVKLTAEDARMRRLLPPAPEGQEWRSEIAYEDTPMIGDVTMRLRYRLVDVEGAEQ